MVTSLPIEGLSSGLGLAPWSGLAGVSWGGGVGAREGAVSTARHPRQPLGPRAPAEVSLGHTAVLPDEGERSLQI